MKKAATFMVEDAVLKQMRQWIASQAAPPSQSAVVEAAIVAFIKKHKDK